MSAPAIVVRRLVGRCADGAELGGGLLWHALETGVVGLAVAGVVVSIGRGWVALCGARPGRHSAGWSQDDGPGVTCPRCLRQLARRAASNSNA